MTHPLVKILVDGIKTSKPFSLPNVIHNVYYSFMQPRKKKKRKKMV
jgi:hypothetical protein